MITNLIELIQMYVKDTILRNARRNITEVEFEILVKTNPQTFNSVD